MSFTLATWNINSVRLREPLVVQFLQQEAPDILCLQECKSPVELIPTEQFAALGYPYLVARGQRVTMGLRSCRNCQLKTKARRTLPVWVMLGMWPRVWKMASQCIISMCLRAAMCPIGTKTKNLDTN